MLEPEYQRILVEKFENTFDNCIVLKNDPNYIQGIPDLTVLYKNKYAMLEVKKSAHEKIQPNQQTYIDIVNEQGGYGSFIYPENEKEVFNELKKFFE